ncbi:MAG: TolC family protein [Planctomycetota bacterium]|jgi:hypothetical protein
MRHVLGLLAIAAACASAPTAPQPEELPFAVAYLDRATAAVAAENDSAPDRAPVMRPRPTPADETRGLLETRPDRIDELRKLASEDAALTALLGTPVSRTDLETLAWLRSPAVHGARDGYEAARTGYRQSTDLQDLVALYRSFLRETKTRVGPEKSRRATAGIAPYPNVDALSGELVDRSVAIAFENLRRTVRDVVAAAERAHADAARLAAARRIIAADVELHESLVKVLRARLESGKTTQAALLAFQSRLESLRTELEVLRQKDAAVRARWNRLLSRPEGAPVNLDVPPAPPAPDTAGPDAGTAIEKALAEHQELRIATLAAERAAVAVRLAETMTLPRMDVGSSRFERERAGEAGVQRGATFPEPGRMTRPRSDFGVREAQVTEMRARSNAAQRSRDAARDATQADARGALFGQDAARRRWLVHSKDVVPLAERAFESSRGAYEGNRTGYIELLDAARRLLRARLGLVDTRRDFAHARARLLQAVGIRTAGRKESK